MTITVFCTCAYLCDVN